MINKKAELLAYGGMDIIEYNNLFMDLYTEVYPVYNIFLQGYVKGKVAIDLSIDNAMFTTAYHDSLMSAVQGYDGSKGDFIPRLLFYAKQRINGVLRYHTTNKRKQEVLVSEFDEVGVLDKYFDEVSPMLGADINRFIETDKHGAIIKIQLLYSNTKDRNIAYTKYFGQYGTRERKIVQRTKERLKKSLKEDY